MKFGGVASSVHVISPESLTAVAPAQVRRTVDVTVTTPDGTGATSGADQFTYDPDTTAPSTTASPSPAPLADNNGWTTGPVTVSLSAADGTYGSGVQNVFYSASGAQTIPLTAVAGSFTSLQLSTEGVTTVTFYATENAGNIESAKTLTVKIVNTAPRVAFGTQPPGNHTCSTSRLRASYSCIYRVDGVDGEVGVASCNSTVPNGSNIKTSPVGTYTAACPA